MYIDFCFFNKSPQVLRDIKKFIPHEAQLKAVYYMASNVIYILSCLWVWGTEILTFGSEHASVWDTETTFIEDQWHRKLIKWTVCDLGTVT